MLCYKNDKSIIELIQQTQYNRSSMGLDIAIEVYDREKRRWITIKLQALEEGRIEEFDLNVELPEALKITEEDLRKNWERQEEEGQTEEEYEKEILDEISCSANKYLFSLYLATMDENNDLYQRLAAAGYEYEGSRIVCLGGRRGTPLDSPMIYSRSWDHKDKYYHPEDHCFESFLTLSELDIVDFTGRIDEPAEMPLKDYLREIGKSPYLYDNKVKPKIVTVNGRTYTGPKLVVTEEQWKNSDRHGKKEMLGHKLYIFVDRPIYLKNIDKFLHYLDLMRKINADPRDIRMILVFYIG